MIFDTPWLLLFAPVLGAAVGILAWVARRKRIRLAGVWSRELRRDAKASGRWGPLWLGLVAFFLGIALAGPRGGRAEVTTESRALSLVMVMDVSRSMLAEDVTPARLGRAVREARRLVHDLAGDRLGLIAFAGRSYILSPLTIDGGAITLHLDALSPELASQGGTSLAAALKQGGELLDASTEVADRVLVLFTDGETHDSLPATLEVARRLGEQNVRLVLVAEGTATPSKIPIRDSSGNLLEYQRTASGDLVKTARRDDVLQQIAEAANGTIIPAEVTDQAGAVRDLTLAFRRNPTVETRTADLLPLAWIPLLVAALVLLGQTFSRRGASLLAIAAFMALPAEVMGQRTTKAERTMRDSTPGAAALEYLELARRGFARDTSYYNAGTAALMSGDLDAASPPLQQATNAVDPALRFRALYNLGVAALKASRQDTSRAQALREMAVQRLKEALLLDPGSADAKWNLELALEDDPPPSGGGGGGGGNQGAPPPPRGDQEQPEADPQPSPSGLTRSQAEQILNSVEREERATRANQQKRRRGRGAAGGKDW
ncbi:MAG: BatA and WFA domain-containing protein [Gemmatimonadales bacterium]